MRPKGPWPQNLYHDIFGEGFLLPQSWEADLEYALGTLTDREQEFIKLRYQEGLTFQQAGQTINNSRQAARLIVDGALKKLRHGENGIILRYGKEDGGVEKEKKKREVKERYLHSVSLKYGETSPEYLAVKKASTYRLQDMGLSIRTAKCLIREGYEYLYELTPLDLDNLLELPNFGHKSLLELKTLMGNLGLIDFTPEDGIFKPESAWPGILIERIFPGGVKRPIEEKNLEDAVDSLPEPYSELLYARYKENLSEALAAERAGIEEKTVRPYESYALTLLRSNPRKAILFHGKDRLEEMLQAKYEVKWARRIDAPAVKLYPIADTELSGRAKTRLLNAGFLYLNELVPLSEDTFVGRRRIGRNALWQLRAILHTLKVVSCEGVFDLDRETDDV